MAAHLARNPRGQPRVMITDKLRSYFKPIRTLAPDADHRAHKGLNNQINTLFRPRRYRLPASSYRHARADAFSLWKDYALEMTA